MLWDAIRGYVQLATGVTEATSDKAREVASGLLSVVGLGNANDVTAQVSGMAEEVLHAARSQRDNLVTLVRTEVTTVIESSGLAKTADVDALTAKLAQVASDVESLVSQLPGAAAAAGAARFVEEHTPGVLTPPGRSARDRSADGSDGGDVRNAEDAPGGEAAPRKTGARRSPAAKKTASSRPGARKTAGTRKTAAAREAGSDESTTANEGAAPRKAAARKATSKKSAAPRKSATASKGAAPRRGTAPRKTASESASTPPLDDAPLAEARPEPQPDADGSDNG